MLATHAPIRRVFNGQIIDLKPGQLITSRKGLSDLTGVEPSKIERILTTLKTEQQIEQVGSFTSRLITIVNWSEYQNCEQLNEQQVNSQRTASEHSQEQKNRRTEEKNSTEVSVVLKVPDAMELAAEIYELYPLKVGRPDAIKAILRAMKKTSTDFLRARTAAYAKAVAGTDTMIPHPSTWFNQERYNDDPSTWVRQVLKNHRPADKFLPGSGSL